MLFEELGSIAMQEELNRRIRTPRWLRIWRRLKRILSLRISRHLQPQYLMGILKGFRNLADEDKLLDGILEDLQKAADLEYTHK